MTDYPNYVKAVEQLAADVTERQGYRDDLVVNLSDAVEIMTTWHADQDKALRYLRRLTGPDLLRTLPIIMGMFTELEAQKFIDMMASAPAAESGDKHVVILHTSGKVSRQTISDIVDTAERYLDEEYDPAVEEEPRCTKPCGPLQHMEGCVNHVVPY